MSVHRAVPVPAEPPSAEPPVLGVFEWVILAKLRSVQLMRGCLPRVEGHTKPAVIARHEVRQGKVRRLIGEPAAVVGEVSPVLANLVPLVAPRS